MIFNDIKGFNLIVKSLFKSKSSYRRSNIWSEQTNTKDLKTQCCYKKEISYEAVSSRKFDTDDVQIDFNGSSTKKEFSTNEI